MSWLGCLVPVTATEQPVDNIIVLQKGSDDAEPKLQDGGAAFFRLSGNVAKKAAWTSSDGFLAQIVFTFEPGTIAASAGSIAVDGGGNAEIDSSSTIDKTLGVTLTPKLPASVTVTTWTWSSSATDKATVAADTTDSAKATVTGVAAGKVTIKATGTGSDGNTCEATIDVTIT